MVPPIWQAGDKALSRWKPRTLSSSSMEQDRSLHPHVPGRTSGWETYFSKIHLHRQGRKRVPFRKRKSESGGWKRIRIGKGSAFQSRWAELTVGYTGRRPLQRRGTGEFSDEVPLETTADDCLVKLGGITRPRPFGWGLFLYTEGDNHGYTM